ncbi:Hypothetical predicted protein [Marmota monax]|uniref:Uncharacterized protein n=1 Tax=Marmota monax TaxID=9995 RepID=A0A5E4BXK7_MARMO|nr:hypothetical protein GHT09_007312 [Marmota monax]VTJ73721.1 Hypothetical predicted protein [Marmota monax]
MNHQALQQSPLVGGGIDAMLTPAHPSLPSVPLPQDPLRPRQPQVRQQQRLLQKRGLRGPVPFLFIVHKAASYCITSWSWAGLVTFWRD